MGAFLAAAFFRIIPYAIREWLPRSRFGDGPRLRGEIVGRIDSAPSWLLSVLTWADRWAGISSHPSRAKATYEGVAVVLLPSSPPECSGRIHERVRYASSSAGREGGRGAVRFATAKAEEKGPEGTSELGK